MSRPDPACFSHQVHNAGVLAYLSRQRETSPLVVPYDAIQNAYYACGCHPDIVERLWDRLAKVLPEESRCIVRGTPALAHFRSGLVLAVGIGTQYAIRVPSKRVAEAQSAGAKTVVRWSGGGTIDASVEFGSDWRFGAWLDHEATWLREAYAAAET